MRTIRATRSHTPLLVALTDDPKQQVGGVDRTDLQGRGLADAQAAGIHESEAGLVDGVPDTAQNRADLSVRQDLRQPPLPGGTKPFFSKTAARRARVFDATGSGFSRDWSRRGRV